MELISNFLTPFILGLLTPTTAVCVLPLYPGFLSYLAKAAQKREDESKAQNKKFLIMFGLIIGLGVISFMFFLGILFTLILKISLTKVIGIVSPIAFIILALISLLLIFNIDLGRFLPKLKTPESKNPYLRAFLFGFFFGAIIIPCNPLFIAAFFTQAALGGADFFINIFKFLFFGAGIAFPLAVISIVSAAISDRVIKFLIKRQKIINLLAGIIMLVISLYYLIFVFF